MSKRIRHRHQRSRTYYRVVRPDGIYDIVSATQFIANVAAGNLIRDKNDPRVARPRKWLSFKIDKRTGELRFDSRRKPAVSEHAPASTDRRQTADNYLVIVTSPARPVRADS